MEQSGIGGGILSALVHASLGGAVLIALLAVVFRLCPRLPATLRFALYLLACARLLVGLAITFPVHLPDSPWTRALSHTATHLPAPEPDTFLRHHPIGASTRTTGVPASSRDAAPTDTTNLPPTTTAASPTSRHFSLPVVTLAGAVVAVWAFGVALAALATLREAIGIRRVVRGAKPLACDDYEDLVDAFQLPSLPDLRISAEIASPIVSGLLRPTIVLPAGFRENLALPEQRLAIAHELAHIRRGDLALNLLLSLTRALFFFHPLAHLAVRECAAAREECCDSLAVRAAGATPAQYGRFLVRFAAAHQKSGQTVNHPVNALGMAAASFRPLRRRLAALSHGSRRAPIALTGVVTLGALVGALPVRFVEASRSPDVPRSSTTADQGPVRFQLIDLGTLGGQSSDATAINDRGAIVGGSNYNPHAIWGHPYVSADAAGMQDMARLTGLPRGVAHAINGSGAVAVEAFARPGRPSAFMVPADRSGTVLLGSLPGFPFSRPLGINDRSEVVGAGVSSHRAFGGGIAMHAFLWRDGALRDLGTLGGPYSVANAVSNHGLVVGKADLSPDTDGHSATHAFLSQDGAPLYDLGVLPGGVSSVANAVDGSGRVVGTSDTIDGTRHAFVVDAGAMRDIGGLPSYPGSHALGINDHGWVVGTAYSGDESAATDSRAVLWILPSTQGAPARILDLNDLIAPGSGWTLEVARSINSHGDIVGQGMYQGRRRAFLLTLTQPVSPTH